MDDISLEHRLTRIEVLVEQSISDLRNLSSHTTTQTSEINASLKLLADHVAIQNGRIKHVEEELQEIAPKVEQTWTSTRDTNVVVRFIREAGGIGNASILFAISVATFIILYTR